jgi:hypothetical protein
LPKAKLTEIEVDSEHAGLVPAKCKDEFVAPLLSSFAEMKRWKKPTTEWDLDRRASEYFKFCEARKLRPTMSSLALAYRTNTSTMYKWKNGIDCTPKWSEIVQESMQFIFSVNDTLAIHGKINPVTWIFMTKNQQGYKDDVSLDEVATAKQSRATALKTLDQIHQDIVVAEYEVVDGRAVEVGSK